jgi:hypothetical protein
MKHCRLPSNGVQSVACCYSKHECEGHCAASIAAPLPHPHPPVLGLQMEKRLRAPGFCSARRHMDRPNMGRLLTRKPLRSPGAAGQAVAVVMVEVCGGDGFCVARRGGILSNVSRGSAGGRM